MSATVPNRKRPSGAAFDGLGRCAHHHQVVARRLTDDGGADRCRLAQDAAHPPRAAVLAHEAVERLLLALQRALAGPLRHDVQHRHLRPEALAQVAGQAHGQLGVRPAAHRHQDRADVVHAALLDHRDVARRLPHHRVDGRREDRRPVTPRSARRLRPRGSGRRRRAAPAEDHEVGALLRHRLDHAVRGPPADADHGADLDLAPRRRSPARAAAGGARCAPGSRPRDRETPSGTSTMPSAVISVARPLLTPEPMRTRSRAVRGLASGSRMRYGARRRGGIRVPGGRGAHLLPARHQVGLELLELAGLRVDHALGLVGGHLQRLADEPRGPPEVERRQRGQQLLAIRARGG